MHRTTLDETVHVPGYPHTLSLRKYPASPYWQVWAFIGGVRKKASSKTERLSEAINIAKDLWLASASRSRSLLESRERDEQECTP